MKHTQKFQKIFLKREFDQLAGKGYRSIVLLTAIFTITITALAVALGGLQDLREKMENPFTNWVNLPIAFSNTSNAVQIMDDFKSRGLLDQFLLDTIRPYREKNPQFISPTNRLMTANYKIRSISPDDKILSDAVLLPENIVHQYVDVKDRDFHCGIIIRQDFFNLSSRELAKLNTVLIMEEVASSRDTAIYHLPILAVVKELPNNCLALLPDNLYRLMGPDGVDFGFVNQEYIRELHAITPAKSATLMDDVNNYLSKTGHSMEVIDLDYRPLNINGELQQVVTMYLDTSYSHIDRKATITDLRVNGKLPIDYYDPYQCQHSTGPLSIAQPQFLALNFAGSTERVRALRAYVAEHYGLELSMGQVEDKENFYMVTRITTILSLLLSIFSVVSILLFIYNLIKMHLERVKPSLGTLSAFGLKQSLLQSSYNKICAWFMLIAAVAGYAISLILKYVLHGTTLVSTSIAVFHPAILLAVALIVVLIYLFTNNFIRQSLNRTPGDLIYRR